MEVDERQARLEQRRAHEAQQARRRRAAAIAVAVAAVVAASAVGAWAVSVIRAGSSDGDGSTTTARSSVEPAPIPGERVYQGLARGHVDGPVDYQAQPFPPVGGPHNPTWQNADGDVYDQPLRPEHAVHALEHGAVWVTYRPDLPAEQLDAARRLVQGIPYRMMSPLPGQRPAIVATAWGRQLPLESAADPRLARFLDQHTMSEAAPEAGGPVTGGRAEP